MYVLIAFLTPLLHALSCIVDAHFSNNIFKKVPSLVFYATISNIVFIFLRNADYSAIRDFSNIVYHLINRSLLSNSLLSCSPQY